MGENNFWDDADLYIRKELGKKILLYRIDKKMTREELASRLDISVSSLRRYECGQRKLTYEVKDKLGAIMGVDLSKLELEIASAFYTLHENVLMTEKVIEELKIIDIYRELNDENQKEVLSFHHLTLGK